MNLAMDRKGHLWSALKAHGFDKKASREVAWLEDLIIRAGEDRPYDFFASLLNQPCPADPDGTALSAIQKRLGPDAMDPLEEFVASALSYEHEEVPTLQGFTHWQRQNDIEVKREMEDSHDQVRIMTIHGAKGLQAPVVILPDTILGPSSKRSEKILWPNRTKLDLPIWSPRKTDNSKLFQTAQDDLDAYQDKEYNRLLYVALTRAEDRLIICGAQPKSAARPESWYFKCRQGLKSLPGNSLKTRTGIDGEILTYKSKQYNEIAPAPDKKEPDEINLPAWINKPAEKEPEPPRPLTPSRPEQTDQPVFTPRKLQEDDIRFQRGRLTHKLLEHLPDIPKDQREKAAKTYLDHARTDLSQDVLEDIRIETLALLNDPDFAGIFGPDSMAEVPISGLGRGTQLVNGQIDRLLIAPDRIMIIDYKTNRPPPSNPADVPQVYIDQLQGYADILKNLYPDREIRAALIWTDGPRLMDMTDLIT